MSTPPEIMKKFEQAVTGLDYGTVTLSLFIKKGRPRYVLAREESYIIDEELPVTDNSPAKERTG
jgi:hypothetical protein